MEKEFKIDIEIAQEIRRLEEMYKHYKKLYRECDSYAVRNKGKQLNIIKMYIRRN